MSDVKSDENFCWQVVPRQSKRGHQNQTFISLRRNGFKISPAFYAKSQIRERNYTHVIVTKDDDRMALLLQFSNKAQIDAFDANDPMLQAVYELQPDGGKPPEGADNRKYDIVNCLNVIVKTPWLDKLATDKSLRNRRYIPVPQKARGQWIVQFLPDFLHEVSIDKFTVSSTQLGIYSLISPLGEVIYIGQGILGRRVRQHLTRNGIDAAAVRYTPLANASMCKAAEAYHLRMFHRRYGKLPHHNALLSTGR